MFIYHPEPRERAAEIAAGALDAIEGAALGLFPAWLPNAEGIRWPGGAGVEAVRAVAMRAAPAVGQFGPFLADLAERAIGGSPLDLCVSCRDTTYWLPLSSWRHTVQPLARPSVRRGGSGQTVVKAVSGQSGNRALVIATYTGPNDVWNRQFSH